MTEITRGQVKRYIHSDGNYCPFCLSMNIQITKVEFESGWQKVICLDCFESWKDVYKLVGVYTEESGIVYPGGNTYKTSEEIREYRRHSFHQWWLKNKDKKRLANRLYKAAHMEEMREYQRQYYKRRKGV